MSVPKTSTSFFTESALRVIERCSRAGAFWTDAAGAGFTTMNSSVPAAFLILALLEEESLASASLRRLELDLEWLRSGGLGPEATAAVRHWEATDSQPDPEDVRPLADECLPESSSADRRKQISRFRTNLPPAFSATLDRALLVARRAGELEHVSSSHLLLAAIELCAAAQEAMQIRGIDLARLRQELGIDATETLERLTVDIKLNADVQETALPSGPSAIQSEQQAAETPAGDKHLRRVLDAVLNRCREGIRVLEDHARFVMNNAELCRQLKHLRHDLVAAEKRLLETSPGAGRDQPRHSLTDVRDVGGDHGTQITVEGEIRRQTIDDLVAANFRRVQEAFRSLEEFGKLLSPEFAANMKQMRYRSYELHSQFSQQALDRTLTGPNETRTTLVEPGSSRRDRLQSANVYVLISAEQCVSDWETAAEEALRGGADIIQLREKRLDDRELLHRACRLVSLCRTYGALMIVNDRPDIAVLAGADGVHVGQEEIPLAEVRRLVGSDLLVGISTHNIQQAIEAEQGGADYLGVGPTFPSRTKQFEDFPGLTFVEEAVRQICIPWFAIGGIGDQQASELSQIGCHRVALSSFVIQSTSPATAVARIKAILKKS